MGKVYSDLRTADYGASGHPEAPFRVRDSFARLKAAGLPPLAPDAAARAGDAALLHDPGHFARVAAGDFDDPDTPAHPGIAETALVSLAGAFSAADAAAGGVPAFSLMRPPGHHAGRARVAGFCYLNNLALALERLRAGGKAARLAVLDIDVHHGDGTQELLLGRDAYLFCSLHQAPLYPGTGLKSEGNCLNFPLPAGTGAAAFLKETERALERILAFKPDILGVSAGFDTYKEDPIAGLKLDKPAYRALGRLIADTKLPRFAVLEGGYSQDLPILIENFLNGFF